MIQIPVHNSGYLNNNLQNRELKNEDWSKPQNEMSRIHQGIFLIGMTTT